MFRNMSVKRRLFLLMGILASAFALNYGVNLYNHYALSEALNDLYYGGSEEIALLHRLSTSLYNKEGESPSEIWKTYLSSPSNTDNAPKQRLLMDSIGQHLGSGNTALAIKEVDQLINWHTEDTAKDYQKAESVLTFNFIFSTLLFLLTLAFSIVVAMMIIKSITKPLHEAVDKVNQLALGDTKLQIDNSFQDEFGLLFEAMQKMNAANKRVVNAVTTFSTGDLRVNVEPRSELDVLAHSVNEMSQSEKKMSEMLGFIANGDLTVSLEPRGDQDILGLSLMKMTKNLTRIISELQNEITTLTSSSQEIVGSISQVATGSAETAAAVAETTTSVEELKQTAHLSDQKAKDVLTKSEETLQIVNASEHALQMTMSDMSQIDEKMKIISTGIVKLSELSQTIREIIDSVNDLAEQSNVLAVNAAIEAAKAGEHGKSFSVVAQEIRTLAEQSKAATVQVRSILNDIQNATSEAVLATEQGSKAVEKGVRQSSETYEFMQKLTQSMNLVAELANEIAGSSQQQLIGVDQVTVAMNNISDAASQHVENMKQIETAVVSLNAVGNSLKEIADRYQLPDKSHKNLITTV